MTDTDTSMGHVTCVIAGYLYQPWMESGISPEPELYKCNTIPILVNIAKILSHLGFLFKQLPFVFTVTSSFLNKSGSLGRRNSLSIAQQPLGSDTRTSSCKYRCAGNATSLNTRYPRQLAPADPTLTQALAEEYPILSIILAILSGSRRGRRCYRSKTDKVILIT